MAFRLIIDTDNAAFEDNPEAELARILRKLADKIEGEGVPFSYEGVRDINGNTCGRYRFRDAESDH